MTDVKSNEPKVAAQLSVWDGVSIIIGIVIGVSIFESPPLIFGNVSGPWQVMAVWVLGGFLSLIGALCYAELTTTYPYSGGDYVYLNRAYGRWVGFLFGWAQLVAILTGSIGAMAYVFASYAASLWSLDGDVWAPWLAASAVVTLAVANIFGVVVGKLVQNLLTIAKLLGVSAIIVTGLVWGNAGEFEVVESSGEAAWGLAMIFVLYTYGGWNDAAFVAADVRDRERNLPRVLLLGTGSIMAIYLLVNAGYLFALGFEGVRNSQAPAAKVLENLLGTWGANGMCVLVMVSALGAVNGMIFTGSRVYASMGADHRVFAFLGHWHPRFKAPIWSLLTAAVVALIMIFTVGTNGGRSLLDRGLTSVGLEPLPWEKFHGGFGTLVSGTAPVFWLFFLLTGVSLFVLRWKDRNITRPFSVPLYPLTPLVFCATSIYMLYSSLTYAKQLALIGLVPLALGIPLYFLSWSVTPSGTTLDSESGQQDGNESD